MKKHLNKILLQGALIILAACSDNDDSKPTCPTILIGDKDGFGMDLEEGEVFTLNGGTMLPVDFRTTPDHRQTDIYPADMGISGTPSHKVELKFTYKPFTDSIRSATLTMLALGIADGDTQVPDSNVDYKLFIDDKEVAMAFDDVDQFGFINGAWSQLASTVVIELPEDILSSLLDGTANVRIELFEYGSIESSPAFAIDYAELTICPEAKH